MRCWFTVMTVSTHSRLKAAGLICCDFLNSINGFNTQPPEGGWLPFIKEDGVISCFNTQPPEGGWFQGLIHLLQP